MIAFDMQSVYVNFVLFLPCFSKERLLKYYIFQTKVFHLETGKVESLFFSLIVDQLTQLHFQ